jgi:hypothetical protein
MTDKHLFQFSINHGHQSLFEASWTIETLRKHDTPWIFREIPIPHWVNGADWVAGDQSTHKAMLVLADNFFEAARLFETIFNGMQTDTCKNETIRNGT